MVRWGNAVLSQAARPGAEALSFIICTSQGMFRSGAVRGHGDHEDPAYNPACDG